MRHSVGAGRLLAFLEGLRDVALLKRLFQSVAMLDAILMPDRQYRYYFFDAHWGPGEAMGSMKNGQGDELFALFNIHGAFLKGFVHEAKTAVVPRQQFYRDVPGQFQQCTREPAFSPENVTFCLWRLSEQPHWSCRKLDSSTTDDGSAYVLSMFDGVPSTYRAWACEYYERDVPLEAIESVYRHRKLTGELVIAINPQQSLERLNSEIIEIAYPV
jgi:hypothetical protein